MNKPRAFLWAFVCFCLALPAVAAGQDFSGANQSNDPCYKIKQMKKFIVQSKDYQQAAGSKDPAYIQCYPLTITVSWDLKDEERKVIGTDSAELNMEEEYPAYLMLNYGWFDKLKKKELERFEILGPEPCYEPCPGRAKVMSMNLIGEIICCMDYPNCRQKKTFNLIPGSFQTSPADSSGQYASLHLRAEGAGAATGEIRSSRLSLNNPAYPKGCGRFWNPFNYVVEIAPAGVDSPYERRMHSQTSITADEIMEGLRTGELKKAIPFAVQYTEPIPGGHSFSLKGTATVTISFVPIEEERWRITVTDRELDNSGLIMYKDPKGHLQDLPVWMETRHTLNGEFVVRKSKSAWSYKEGSVTKHTRSTKLLFQGIDLYKCDIIPCPGLASGESYVGAALGGEMTGHSVKLEWHSPGDLAKTCVLCKPLKSFLEKTPYRWKAGSLTLFDQLSQAVLPLINGYTKTGKVQDWMTYTITLTKIK